MQPKFLCRKTEIQISGGGGKRLFFPPLRIVIKSWKINFFAWKFFWWKLCNFVVHKNFFLEVGQLPSILEQPANQKHQKSVKNVISWKPVIVTSYHYYCVFLQTKNFGRPRVPRAHAYESFFYSKCSKIFYSNSKKFGENVRNFCFFMRPSDRGLVSWKLKFR